MGYSDLEDLKVLLRSCQKQDAQSQKRLYRDFYGFSLSIALRYTKDKEEAIEVLNDSFMKVFSSGLQKFEIENLRSEAGFKTWLKKIIINTGIDYYRKNKKHYYQENIDEFHKNKPDIQPSVTDNLSYEEMLTLIKKLSPDYYTVFCLYVLDGYTHEEIADKLGISAGTSKSNLAKARQRLKEMIKKEHYDEYARYIG
jgi:RNA polymerase sigma-70 factor (ECF subfamily)